MTRWERFFLIVQRTSSVLVLLFAVTFLVMLAAERSDRWRYEREFGSDFGPTLPYSAQEIETPDGTLIALMEDNGTPGERIERGGITMTNPTTGKFIEIAPEASPNVIQFELIRNNGERGKVVGYVATIASDAQFEEGRQDVVVGALPAMTRNVVARNIRYLDSAMMKSDGTLGMQMWPEEGEAYLIAVRPEDGAIIERTKVKLPALKRSSSSSGA